jgi:hypothetical protein
LIATNNKRILTLPVVVIIIALLFPFSSVNAENQTATTFMPSDRFSIPELNSTISFALNGSFTSASLVNHSWVFTNLRLNGSQSSGNLTISVENSNITIFLYRSSNFFARSATLRYNAQGVGTQTVNLGLNLTQTQPIEWSISVPTVAGIRSGFLAEGTNWKLLPNNSVFVYDLTGNISVSHFNFNIPNNSNLPFYLQHSIIIITVIVFSVVVAVAVVIQIKVRR